LLPLPLEVCFYVFAPSWAKSWNKPWDVLPWCIIGHGISWLHASVRSPLFLHHLVPAFLDNVLLVPRKLMWPSQATVPNPLSPLEKRGLESLASETITSITLDLGMQTSASSVFLQLWTWPHYFCIKCMTESQHIYIHSNMQIT
jgi:hypothetical protein